MTFLPNWIFSRENVIFSGNLRSNDRAEITITTFLNLLILYHFEKESVNQMNKPYITPVHIVAELMGFIFAIASLIYAIVKASVTRGEIPTHFDFAGNIDGYGSPWGLIILPLILIATLIVTALTLHFAPASSFNFPFKVNPENAVKVYADAAMAIALLETEIGLYSLIETLLFSAAKSSVFPSIILTLSLIVTVIILLRKAAKDNKQIQ